MPPLFILCLILIGLVAFPDSGKASGSRPEKKVEWQETDLIQGYALLYGIADKQRQLDLILIVKTAQKPTAKLAREITSVYGDLFDYLKKREIRSQKISQAGSGLPQAETSTRQKIEITKTKQLLGRSGRDFDLSLLSTQIEALTYSVALLDQIVLHESSEENKTRAAEFRKKLESLSAGVWQELKRL
jgi:hypothetical protein